MRRLYVVLISHALASYICLVGMLFLKWMRGERVNPRDGHDVVVWVLWPVLQILLVPHYVLDVLFRRFDWKPIAYDVTHVVAFTAIYYALRRGTQTRRGVA